MSNVSEHKEKEQKPSLWQLVVSVLGAAFGVQSSKTRERDFKQADPKAYIIGGIVFGVLFVLTLALIVKLVLSNVT
ncbi:conserved hypothetical protein [Hahella chejuensis KCTC 2396]|uniref:DUF2970 domain-containing protein n=1 Tax=Hahella chejuensis (strain KCTC 2396) TaxID=349521 RepID=Q2SJ32_HAHCH|nr:DUF2970 domain-containing protein [Hahella chejuensis]ABC29342.1 conserved hypothetical protein [Hahella chejuensis KCTC 2396]